MGPPADLPSRPTTDPIHLSHHFAPASKQGPLPDICALPQLYRTLEAPLRHGWDRLLNDDGVANADTPPPTPRKDHAANRHARAAERPMGFRLP